MQSFKSFILEVQNKGVEYENLIKKKIRTIVKDYDNISIKRSVGKGSFSAHDVDLSLNINKKTYNIEMKKTASEQMSGISFQFDKNKNDFIITPKNLSKLDDETMEILKAGVSAKKSSVNKLLDFFEKNDPVWKYNKIKGFPLKVSRDEWIKAKNKNMVKNINLAIKYNAEFINKIYAKKKVNYIQLGKSGLFYMNDNPLKLPIPQLSGNIDIEFRATPSGVKKDKTHNVDYATVMLRLQGRLKFKGKSTLSLDNDKDIKKIFDILKE